MSGLIEIPYSIPGSILVSDEIYDCDVLAPLRFGAAAGKYIVVSGFQIIILQ